MAVLDDETDTGLSLVEGATAVWSPPQALSRYQPQDFRAHYERERARADAAQARCEELRHAEREARSRAGLLKWNLDKSRDKLEAAVEEVKEVRRTAKNALGLRAEVTRLEKLLAQAGVESSKRSTNMSLRMEVARLREGNDRLRAASVRATERVALLRAKNAELRAEVRELEAEKTALSSCIETLQTQLEKLRATGRVLSRSMFGRKSERQKKPQTGRTRGQQRGAPGHGRALRPKLERRTEKRNPPKDARVCPRCAKPYVTNGERTTTVVEVEVNTYAREIVRTRWRRSCECASSPREVTAPPVARLFEGTPYGISVWVCVLFERFACRRPLHRVAAWLADMGLTIAPGTLADSIKRFVALFTPLAKATLAHQHTAALRHADETTWRVQGLREKGRSSRAWLWVSLSSDAVYFHVDPSRSAEVAKALFGAVKGTVVLVCDRLSSYKRLARELDGKVVLQWCWAHQRRSFIDCASGRVRLSRWCEGWVERIAELYRLNDERLKHYDPALERQTPQFDAQQGALSKAVDGLFAHAEAELAGLSDTALRAKPLRSLMNHREGLSVFVDHPHVPPDNNRAELALRSAVIGRRLSFGSDSETGARFTAVMYSVVGTLEMNGIDVRRWLEEWLTTCAKNGGKPPDNLSPWLPWSMSEARKQALAAPR